MIKKMNLVRPALLAALLCGASALSALAQQGPAVSPTPGSPAPLAPPPPPSQSHHGPPPSPLFDALDTNHDGIISAEEIANAATSLRKLLKPGSDHLTREDLRPEGAPPPPPAAAPGRPIPEEDAVIPRPKVRPIRPHNPPPVDDSEATVPADPPHMHPPGPGFGPDADAEADRPPFRREWQRDRQRSEDEMDDAQAPFHRERMSRHEDPARSEKSGRPEDDARPHHEIARGDDEARPHRRPHPDDGGRPQDNLRPHPQHAPPSPLFDAIDANHDGIISADEIANASAALKALLKPGNDHLTREDLRPTGPPPGER